MVFMAATMCRPTESAAAMAAAKQKSRQSEQSNPNVLLGRQYTTST
jgi:hypothetical protein